MPAAIASCSATWVMAAGRLLTLTASAGKLASVKVPVFWPAR
jgi:hypothetical protein